MSRLGFLSSHNEVISGVPRGGKAVRLLSFPGEIPGGRGRGGLELHGCQH